MQIIKTLKTFFRRGIFIPVLVFITVSVNAGNNNYLNYMSLPDSTKKLDRKLVKSDRKEERKK